MRHRRRRPHYFEPCSLRTISPNKSNQFHYYVYVSLHAIWFALFVHLLQFYFQFNLNSLEFYFIIESFLFVKWKRISRDRWTINFSNHFILIFDLLLQFHRYDSNMYFVCLFNRLIHTNFINTIKRIIKQKRLDLKKKIIGHRICGNAWCLIIFIKWRIFFAWKFYVIIVIYNRNVYIVKEKKWIFSNSFMIGFNTVLKLFRFLKSTDGRHSI